MLSRGQQNAVLGKIAFSPWNHLAGCEQAWTRALLWKEEGCREKEGKKAVGRKQRQGPWDEGGAGGDRAHHSLFHLLSKLAYRAEGPNGMQSGVRLEVTQTQMEREVWGQNSGDWVFLVSRERQGAKVSSGGAQPHGITIVRV